MITEIIWVEPQQVDPESGQEENDEGYILKIHYIDHLGKQRILPLKVSDGYVLNHRLVRTLNQVLGSRHLQAERVRNRLSQVYRGAPIVLAELPEH